MALPAVARGEPAVGGRLPAIRSAYPGSGMAGLPRNGWLVSVGITGRLASESAAALRRNTHRRFARRNNKAHPYLLRGLVSCGVCGLACLARATIHGVVRRSGARGREDGNRRDGRARALAIVERQGPGRAARFRPNPRRHAPLPGRAGWPQLHRALTQAVDRTAGAEQLSRQPERLAGQLRRAAPGRTADWHGAGRGRGQLPGEPPDEQLVAGPRARSGNAVHWTQSAPRYAAARGLFTGSYYFGIAPSARREIVGTRDKGRELFSLR